MHPDAWPKPLQSQLVSAEAIQPLLDVPAHIAVHSIYSARRATLWRLAVDRFWTITGREKKRDGDETVPSSSARARSHHGLEFEVTGELTEHTALCRHPEVHRLLKEAIS